MFYVVTQHVYFFLPCDVSIEAKKKTNKNIICQNLSLLFLRSVCAYRYWTWDQREAINIILVQVFAAICSLSYITVSLSGNVHSHCHTPLDHAHFV